MPLTGALIVAQRLIDPSIGRGDLYQALERGSVTLLVCAVGLSVLTVALARQRILALSVTWIIMVLEILIIPRLWPYS